MRSAILPFWPVLRDFIRNLWVLRFFVFLCALLLLIASFILAWIEAPLVDQNGTMMHAGWNFFRITLMDIFLGLNDRTIFRTSAGKVVDLLISCLRPILFGVLVWVVQQSLSGHTLKSSKCLLFPTREDV